MIGFPGEGFADEKSIVDSWLTSYLGHDVPLPPKILVAKTQEVINHKAFVAVPVMIMVNKQKYNLQSENRNKNHMTQGKIDLRNESGRPMKVKVVGEVSEK